MNSKIRFFVSKYHRNATKAKKIIKGSDEQASNGI